MVAQALANSREEFINLDTKLVENVLRLEQIIRYDDPEPRSLITESLPRVAERLLIGPTHKARLSISISPQCISSRVFTFRASTSFSRLCGSLK
jgi:hypothetical protein